MNILVTGANGQLGHEIQNLAACQTNNHFFFTDIAQLDITNYEDILKYIQKNDIQAIINCAAYTAVDKAESEEPLAYKINASAVKNIVDATLKYHLFLIHISTDYVFNGEKTTAYLPTDIPSPISAYGRTKLSGENMILEKNIRACIIRTAWLYSAYGHNFVKTMLQIGKERQEVSVVSDQYGAPTYAADLASACLKILSQNECILKPEIFHYSNLGQISWYDFAVEIMKQAHLNCHVKPIFSEAYPSKVKRPKYSLLDTNCIQKKFHLSIPQWQDSLSLCISQLEKLS